MVVSKWEEGGKTQVTTELMAMIQFLLVPFELLLLIPFTCFIDYVFHDYFMPDKKIMLKH